MLSIMDDTNPVTHIMRSARKDTSMNYIGDVLIDGIYQLAGVEIDECTDSITLSCGNSKDLVWQYLFGKAFIEREAEMEIEITTNYGQQKNLRAKFARLCTRPNMTFTLDPTTGTYIQGEEEYHIDENWITMSVLK
jgi:hypothetical protein